MALVNEQHKFIFFHLFKCAGNSMRKILNTSDDSNICYELYGGHSLPSETKELMYDNGKKNIYDEYYKFTIIRNPFDWLLSTYNYILAYKVHGHHEAVKDMDLAQFIQYYVDVMMLNKGRGKGGNKCITLYDYITDKDGNVLLDHIGRFENLEADMKVILEKVGVPYQPTPFINVNPKREADYRVSYTQEAKDLVEKYFEKDLDYFNYQF